MTIVILGCSCTVALWLIIWFKTKAFVEYLNFLTFFSRVCKVQQYHEIEIDLTYPEFLVEYYNNFFTRLISCPVCFSVWLGLIGALPTWFTFGFLFYILVMPIITLFGLILYLITSKML